MRVYKIMIYLERRQIFDISNIGMDYEHDEYYLVMDNKREKTFNLIIGSFTISFTKKIDLFNYGVRQPNRERLVQDKLKYTRDYAINLLL